MRSDLVRRTVTICIVAPTITFLLLTSRLATLTLVTSLMFVAMIEWTGLKRHLKVALLDSYSQSKFSAPRGFDFPVPAVKPNLFILVKCAVCSLMCPVALLGPMYFHLATSVYFIFWVCFTLLNQQQSEVAITTRRRALSTGEKNSTTKKEEDISEEERFSEQFAFHEHDVITRHFSADLFLSFALEYFGFVWVAGMGYAMLLYCIPNYGPAMLLIVLASNWANDIVALLVGRSMKGRTHPLSSRISPNKSIEGALSGIVASGVSAVLLELALVSHLPWPYPHVPLFFFMGIFFGVGGVIGDLLQSLFKRSARIKDTGTFFPGHGGVLDRVDGLIVLLPPAYWLMWLYLQDDLPQM